MRIPVAVILIAMFAAGADARAEEVEGFGRTIDDAKLDARQHVLQRMQASLDHRESTFWGWQPTLADVDGFLDGPGRAGPSLDVKPLGVQHCWILNVMMPNEAQLTLRDRQSSRQRLATLAVLACTVGCASWWGFGRVSRRFGRTR